ncbi:MAG TPA: aspartate aminotransferase family protein [Chloroflexota bacterium]|jgi:glutamate-1-semialdehyde 2,1-aminomutase|nr:aspartate aminotransferase family protein [Chloroflexota bacterium]
MTETRGSTTLGANAFLDPGSTTARAHAAASEVIPGGTSRLHYHFAPYPIRARRGEGCHLVDAEGVRRLDFLNNMTALIHGHGHPAVKRAILEQLDRGTAFSEPTDEEVGLARLIAERVASVERIRFANSGTEAVMFAVKLARAFTGRSRIAKFEGFYHGYYDYVQVSFNSTPANWGDPAAPASTPSSGGLADDVLGQVLTLPYNDRPGVERLLEQHGRSLAAVIVDPLSNRAGFPPPADGFLPFLREIARSYGVVLVYDEVISFRLGRGGAQGKYGGDPDLTTFGKVIGGGLPVGAVGGRAEVMALLDPSGGAPRVISGGTFSGNPLTMAAGLAAVEAMTSDEFARLDRLGERLRGGANALFREAGVPGQLTGDGSLFRILLTDEPIVDYRSSVRRAAPAARMAKLHRELLDEGVVISITGLGCLSTPMADPEVDAFLGALERALARLT